MAHLSVAADFLAMKYPSSPMLLVAHALGDTFNAVIAPAARTRDASLDYALFRMVNGMAAHHAALDTVMVAFARYSPVFFALVLAALWLTWKPSNQRGAVLAGMAALVALGTGQLVGLLFPRPRPYLAHHVTLLITHSPDTSFPSDHATLGFAVAMMVGRYNRAVAGVVVVVATIMSFARVFVGAHYPGDLLGGAVLGVATSVALDALSRRTPLRSVLDRMLAMLAHWHVAASPADNG